MAEPFGIVAGVISITPAFTARADFLEYIQFGRHLGWGESVNIYDDPRLGRQDVNPANIQLVKDALLQILVFFADTESICKRYRLTANAGEDLSACSISDMDPKMVKPHDQEPRRSARRRLGDA